MLRVKLLKMCSAVVEKLEICRPIKILGRSSLPENC